MDFHQRYSQLNSAQKQAVDTIDGPVMVIAGPGTGKTELLSIRTANILTKTDTLPENILCLTFTDSGATAMRERLKGIIGPNAYKVAIHTFHSFGTEIINQNGQFFYQGARFRAADELSTYQLLSRIFDELAYDNPLASKVNGEYTYLRDVLTVISELKKSGLTSDELLAVLDANDAVIDIAEPLLAETFTKRVTKVTIPQLKEVLAPIRSSHREMTIPGITSLSTVLADSLEDAISAAMAAGSTKPISAWRSRWLKKDAAGRLILKSRERSTKLRACSYLYYQYLARMQEAELYDFDDMILRVVHAMEVFPDLRFNLQEKYQYIMVDEFQDTNLAQMRILANLTNNEVNNGRPNILVVGDDDQAIYSFQGAEVGNMAGFLSLYPQTTLITLRDNYRSTKTILDHARSVITLGSDRLEGHLKDLDKTLQAHQTAEDTKVALVELPSAGSEYSWLMKRISELIKTGATPSSIAVLARRHAEIEALLPYFTQAGISVAYDRRDNILDIDLIRLIEHLALILIALNEQRFADADSLLPELLAHPAFHISALQLWRLGLGAHTARQTWLEAMAGTPDLVPLQMWLIELAKTSVHAPLERILDEMIGTPPYVPPRTHTTEPAEREYTSPIYAYYFSSEKLALNPDSYLLYLEALRTLRAKIREYQPDKIPTLKSLVEFLSLNRELGSTITSLRSAAGSATEAVHLMTAHRSKGLEFDHVFIVGAIDSTWGERVRSRTRLISYPENLPLAPSGDTFDERLRLFFVAMTRARRQLTISYSLTDSHNKATLRASFLTTESWQAEVPQLPSDLHTLTQAAEAAWYQPLVRPITGSMRELLQPTLENYKLSSTHLNAFLDVSRGGPQHFLVHHLLRFPQAVSPSAGYGLAIHAALQRAHAHLAATGKHRPLEDILNDFETSLRAQFLQPDDFKNYLQKGIDTLSAFLPAKYNEFTQTQKAELNFAGQNVFVEGVRLTGLLDVVDMQGNTITVIDYKTGRASRGWTGKTDYEKIKLHKYKQQLMFYNLLTTHSRDYSKYTTWQGAIEFVEPTAAAELIRLEATFSNEDLATFRTLLQKVWHCIVTLDLPDVSRYEPTYKGMLAFEADLLDTYTTH